MKQIWMTVFLMQTILVSLAHASTEIATKSNDAFASSANSKSHNFEDLLINGKYHFSDEAVSTVEADKVFDSLIGVRNDFKDRLEESSTSK